MNESEIKYLELLSKSFPSIPATAAEIVRLQAILELPKTTEHFMSDIHGEYTYFSHILKNASGAIHDKINDSFGDLLGEEEKNSLARLLYYPERELAAAAHSDSWYRVTIHRLVAVCRQATDKYTRVKVRARLPKEYAYIIEELIDSDEHDPNKRRYFESIINSVIETGIADRFIVALANLISRLTVNQLHIVGDVFDRGPPRRWSWTISWTCTAWTSSGATTTFSGWARPWATLRALRTPCETRSSTATLICSRTATA